MTTSTDTPPRPMSPDDTRVWRLMVRLLTRPPEGARRPILIGLGVWSVMIALQIWDIRGRTGPAVVAEVLGMPLGSAAMLLVAAAGVLVKSSEIAARDDRGTRAPSCPALDRIRLALPAIGFVAGALAAVAIGLLVMRGLLGTEPLFIGFAVAAHLVVIGFAGHLVNHSTAFLYAHARDRAAAAARAEAEAAAAQLEALQAQINPHFLFNALNTVASLVRTDARQAERTVEHLSDVLRRTLARSRETLRTVADEVEYLRAYLAIEEARWDERLAVDWAVSSDTLGLSVPPMTLQPLVENALKHGVGPRLEGGRIRVESRRDGQSLVLVVEDNGVGFPRAVVEGTGLTNLRRRLVTLYGERADLTIDRPSVGARVVVRVPIVPAAAGRDASR